MAMAAWSANVVTQFDLLVGEWARLGARQGHHANRRAFAHHRYGQKRAIIAEPLRLVKMIVRVFLHVRNVNHHAFEQRASCGRATVRNDGNVPDMVHEFAGEAEALGAIESPILLPGDGALVGLAKPRRRFNQGSQDCSKIKCGTADDLEHVGGRSLLLQRFAQILGARLHFVEQPRIFDGDHRLIGEGGYKLDLFLGKGLRQYLVDEDDADDRPVAQERDAKCGSIAADLLNLTPGIFRVRQHVGDVHHPTLKRASSRDAAAFEGNVMSLQIVPEPRVRFGGVTEAGRKAKKVALALEQPCMIGVTEPCRGFDQCIEHRLQIERRTADDLEHICGRGLLLQKFRQVFRARLHFIEQPHVFDGDHGLIGEGGYEFDLLVCKRRNIRPTERNHPNRCALTQQGYAEHCTKATAFDGFTPGVFRIDGRIRNMDHPSLEYGSTDEGVSSSLDDLMLHPLAIFTCEAVVSRQLECVALAPKYHCIVRVAKRRCELDQRVENCLQVEGRTADNLEHVGGRRLLLQGFAQILGARLHLVEQPHVFDGDHGLIGESRDQLDLLLV